MRRVGLASFVAVLLVVALGHRWSVTASWFTSDKTCRERHATPWFVERLGIDCDRLLRERYGSSMAKANSPITRDNSEFCRTSDSWGPGRLTGRSDAVAC
jgi:hypothetical protein